MHYEIYLLKRHKQSIFVSYITYKKSNILEITINDKEKLEFLNKETDKLGERTEQDIKGYLARMKKALEG